MKDNLIIAIVGMPGAGKSEAISYIKKKGIPFVRFGQITDDGLSVSGLPVTAENEQNFREKLRQDLGMAAYAIKSKPKIDELCAQSKTIAIDGLYSWEEYIYLKNLYPNLIAVSILAETKKRYERLAKRKVRPLSAEEAVKRDIAELGKLNKGGPIAIADYFIENNGDETNELFKKIDLLFNRLKINQ